MNPYIVGNMFPQGSKNVASIPYGFTTFHGPNQQSQQVFGQFGQSPNGLSQSFDRNNITMGSFSQNSIGQNCFDSNLNGFSGQSSANLVATPFTVNDPNWYLDSGATNHVVGDGEGLLQHFEYNGNNKLLFGKSLNITGVGNTFVYSLPYYLKLIGVLVVPNIAKNLLSISKLTLDNNVVAEFYSDCCLIKDKQLGVVILK